MSQSECGPPKVMIPKDVLENLIEGFAKKNQTNNANIATKT
jgi:hypothetical protein